MATESELDRFLANVDKRGPDECWEWKNAAGRWNYGRFAIDGKAMGAHRASFIIHYGEIPADKPCVCHRCDNPKCVNPAHLFAGTNGENIQDAWAKGRYEARHDAVRRANRTPLDRVLSIIEGIKAGKAVKIVAEENGVSSTVVYQIKNTMQDNPESLPYGYIQKRPNY